MSNFIKQFYLKYRNKYRTKKLIKEGTITINPNNPNEWVYEKDGIVGYSNDGGKKYRTALRTEKEFDYVKRKNEIEAIQNGELDYIFDYLSNADTEFIYTKDGIIKKDIEKEAMGMNVNEKLQYAMRVGAPLHLEEVESSQGWLYTRFIELEGMLFKLVSEEELEDTEGIEEQESGKASQLNYYITDENVGFTTDMFDGGQYGEGEEAYDKEDLEKARNKIKEANEETIKANKEKLEEEIMHNVKKMKSKLQARKLIDIIKVQDMAEVLAEYKRNLETLEFDGEVIRELVLAYQESIMNN